MAQGISMEYILIVLGVMNLIGLVFLWKCCAAINNTLEGIRNPNKDISRIDTWL